MKNPFREKLHAMRRARLAKLIHDNYKNSKTAFIDATGINQGELSSLLKNKSFGEIKARGIEAKCDLPEFWLDGELAPLVASDQARAVALVFDQLNEKQQNAILAQLDSFDVQVPRHPRAPVLRIGANANTLHHDTKPHGSSLSESSSEED